MIGMGIVGWGKWNTYPYPHVHVKYIFNIFFINNLYIKYMCVCNENYRKLKTFIIICFFLQTIPYEEFKF